MTTDEMQVQQNVTAITTVASSLVVKNDDEYEMAGEHLRQIKSINKNVDELFDPQVKKAHEAHRAAVALKNKFLQPLKNAEGQLKRAMLQFVEDRNARVRHEQGRLQRVADEKADRERKALEARAAAAKTEKKTRELEHKAAAVVAPEVQVSTPQPQAEGISTRKKWKALITNKALVPEYYKIVDYACLNKLGNQTKGTAQIPGVEWEEVTGIAARV